MPALSTKKIQFENPVVAIEREWLREFVQQAQGDPRLTAHEEMFVADMRNFAQRTGRYADTPEDWSLTRKQVELALSISAKVELPIKPEWEMEGEHELDPDDLDYN